MYVDPAGKGGVQQAGQRLKVHEAPFSSEVLAEGPEDEELFVSATGEPDAGAAAMEGVTQPAAVAAPTTTTTESSGGSSLLPWCCHRA